MSVEVSNSFVPSVPMVKVEVLLDANEVPELIIVPSVALMS